MSILLHALVLAVFAFGISRGFHVAQRRNGQDWLELGADIRPSASPRQLKLHELKQPTNAPLATELQAGAPAAEPNSVSVQGESDSSGSRETAESTYVNELASLLNRAKRYPRESIAREQEGRVVVAVSVDREGNVHETQISTPSPFRLLNEAALETVGRIGKFPAPPAILLSDAGGHGIGSRRLKIPISFRIERP